MSLQSSTDSILSISFIYACLADPGMYLKVIFFFIHSTNMYISHTKEILFIGLFPFYKLLIKLNLSQSLILSSKFFYVLMETNSFQL